MSNAEQADGRVTLLQFLRVLPSSAWLRSSILWADDLAAVWPMYDPTPLSHAQDKSHQEVWALLNAGLFERKVLIDYLSPGTAQGESDAIDEVATEIATAGSGRPPPAGWEDGGPGPGPTRSAARVNLGEDDLKTFVYPDKLPETVITQLIRRKLIAPRPDGQGYTASSAEFLDRLLAGYARVLQARSGGRLLPDVEEPDQARRIAAPVNAGPSRQAIVLTLRGGLAPDLETDFDKFLAFRANAENERARRDYIDELTGLWAGFARGGPGNASTQTLRRAAADLAAARQSYLKRVTAQTLAGQALSCVSVLIPLAFSHPPAAVAAALAAIGGSAVTIAVRNDAPTYLRRATKSELLAPIAF